jgi:hypothetical protein
MSDPRFNSLHLDASPRRDDYRRARALLLGACGFQTLAIEQERVAEDCPGQPHTIIEQPDIRPVGIDFWIKDKYGTYPLKPGLNSIGRMPNNDVVIADGSVSRRHCAIVVHQNRGCELHDTASKNGTFLNGKRITGPTRLVHGDVIRMCDHEVLFQTDETPLPADSPALCPTIG